MPLSSQLSHSSNRGVIISFHILTWIAIFILPTMTNHFNSSFFQTEHLVRMVCPPVLLSLVFYFNYVYVMPKLVLRNHLRKGSFMAVLSILIGLGALNGYMTAVDHFFPRQMTKGFIELGPSTLQRILFTFRDMLVYGLVIMFALLLRMAEAWQDATKARQAAEIKQKEAELQNMRNQISPHFLLNTLNNIYALTAFNSDKAQQAILDLSGLLRHMLYDSQEALVDIHKELKFLHAYINLMMLRQSDNVDVRFNTNIAPDTHFNVAPLICISLIENAFKHGVSANHRSFINIAFDCNPSEGTLSLTIENSNFPKRNDDKSGSGIGLAQVQRRLDLTYPNAYTWDHHVSPDGLTYISRLTVRPECKQHKHANP